jgi:hypothetical protein
MGRVRFGTSHLRIGVRCLRADMRCVGLGSSLIGVRLRCGRIGPRSVSICLSLLSFGLRSRDVACRRGLSLAGGDLRFVDLTPCLGPDLVDLSSRVGPSSVRFIASRRPRVLRRTVCLIDLARRRGPSVIHQPCRLDAGVFDLAGRLGTSVSHLLLCLVALHVRGGDLGGGLRAYFGQAPLQPRRRDLGVECIDQRLDDLLESLSYLVGPGDLTAQPRRRSLAQPGVAGLPLAGAVVVAAIPERPSGRLSLRYRSAAVGARPVRRDVSVPNGR